MRCNNSLVVAPGEEYPQTVLALLDDIRLGPFHFCIRFAIFLSRRSDCLYFFYFLPGLSWLLFFFFFSGQVPFMLSFFFSGI